MAKPTLLIALVFFFLFFSIPSLAYLPIAVNQSITLGVFTPKALYCNATYCYSITSGGGITNRIYSWNSTLQNATYCTLDNTYTILGGWLNSTTAVAQYGSYAKMYNMSDVREGGACPLLVQYNDCGYQDTIDTARGVIYGDKYYVGAGVYNLSCSQESSPSWNAGNDTAMIVNMSNVTDGLWATYEQGDPYISSTGSTVGSPGVMWGFSGYPSLLKENASTTWLYAISHCSAASCGVEKSYIYKVNFTKAITAGYGTNITATYPIGNQSLSAVLDESTDLTVALDTANNGTISWYLDTTFLGNTSITAPFDNLKYFSTGVLTDGQHYWNATFYDLYGNSWNTGNQTFFREETSAITTVAQSLANAFGVDLDWGKGLFALLISSTLSGALAYYVSHNLFIPSMLACVFFFAMAGFFPAWFTLVFVVLAGVLFAKYSKLI